jgi:hypothetical protein
VNGGHDLKYFNIFRHGIRSRSRKNKGEVRHSARKKAGKKYNG